MSAMEVASGVRSTLNPNAPLFIPAAYRQVEDFSPEWWELVKTSTWFHDYWVKQHAEDESCGGNDDEDDIVNLLPDSFDACLCDEIPNLENQLEQAIWSATNEGKGMPLSGNENVNSETLIKSLNLKSPRGGEAKPLPEPLKYRGRPTLNHASPRRIQQPR